MKQKIVIKVCMPCKKCRSRAMTLAAKTAGVSSMRITGDEKDRLEVVGDGVDPVCLVSCLRKEVGHAQILQVEEVKDKKPDKKPDKEPVLPLPPPPCPDYYCPLHVVIRDEPSPCSMM